MVEHDDDRSPLLNLMSRVAGEVNEFIDDDLRPRAQVTELDTRRLVSRPTPSTTVRQREVSQLRSAIAELTEKVELLAATTDRRAGRHRGRPTADRDESGGAGR